MITNIMNTPYSKPISFANKTKTLNDAVNFVFSNLSRSRNKNGLGLYLGKIGDTNFVFEKII